MCMCVNVCVCLCARALTYVCVSCTTAMCCVCVRACASTWVGFVCAHASHVRKAPDDGDGKNNPASLVQIREIYCLLLTVDESYCCELFSVTPTRAHVALNELCGSTPGQAFNGASTCYVVVSTPLLRQSCVAAGSSRRAFTCVAAAVKGPVHGFGAAQSNWKSPREKNRI